MEKVRVEKKLQTIDTYWTPYVVGELNGQHVKLAKLEGEFVWHHHADEDELFYVVKGKLILRFRDHDVALEPGEFCIVTKGVEHLPIAREEVHVMLFEPVGTLNTGNVKDARTVDNPGHL
jgi:mannose-6-phosphate isomerase-like protein (cupin superfamily)